MKNIIISISTLIISMSMFSCDSRDKMVQQTEQEIKEQMLDPNSYEYIKSKVLTIKTSQNIQALKSHDSSMMSLYLDFCESRLRTLNIWSGSTSSYGISRFNEELEVVKEYKDSASVYNDRIKEKERIIQEIKGTDKDTIRFYTVHLTYYGVNRKGERRINDYFKCFKPNKEPMKVVVP